jgi:S-layer protein (TIGR01567 family)
MVHLRAVGVCLLLIILAAALPMDVWAQTRQGSGVAVIPVTNENFFSKGVVPGESVSPEKLAGIGGEVKSAKIPQPASSPTLPVQKSSNNADQTLPEQTAQLDEKMVNQVQPLEAGASPGPNQTMSPATAREETLAGSNLQNTTGTPEAAQSENRTVSKAVAANQTPEVVVQKMVPQEPSKPEPSLNNATLFQNQTANATEVVSPENLTPKNVTAENASAESVAAENVTAENVTAENVSAGGVPAETAAAVPLTEQPLVDTDRIWREGINPEIYTWTPQTFSGFFYDLKDDVGTEKLTIKLKKSGAHYGRSIDSGDLIYSSDVQNLDYKFEDWGSYQVMGFMADKYFAGYNINNIFDKEKSLINEGQLRKVLIDNDEDRTITSGSVLPLEEGYELRIKEVDINGNKVYLGLAKDGSEIDSKVISPDSLKAATYQYKIKIGGDDVPIIMAHISNVFASAESNLVTVNGLFQISDDYAPVEDGDKYDKMKVTSVSDAGIEMKNEDSLTLRKGSTVKIFGNVGFQVADADELRFAPTVARTGAYEVRGTVINPAKTDSFTWTPYNFEGFYYDIDDDVGTESLDAKISGGNKIEEKDLVYRTSPQRIKFKFEDWGKYEVIGFMADKYFAGYANDTEFTDEASAINEGQLRKVLIDSDDDQTIATGSVLPLKEGYELRIKQVDINGNKVYLALARDGQEIDSKVVTPASASDRASNYIYKVDMGAEKDVPIVVAHIQSVFRGTETDLATVDGLFQLSDNPESVEEGEMHGRMKVDSLGDQGIVMKNDATITLGRGRTIELMGNMKFEVADNVNRLLAPLAEKAGTGDTMTLSIPDAVVNQSVTIGVKWGTQALSGVSVQVDNRLIGTTDATGSISYTPESTGTFDVLARKSGYNDAKGSLVVRTAAEAAAKAVNATTSRQMAISVPSQVLTGEQFLITVTGGANLTPIEDANISFDGLSIGNTSTQGTLPYSSNATGEHTITAKKTGYDEATAKLQVTSAIVIQKMTLPEKANAGEGIQIGASLQNTGPEKETRKLELKVNGEVVETKEVTLEPGTNSTATFSYKPKDPGTYKISVDGQETTLNVEKAQTNYALIAIILVLLIAAGAGIYLYRTGELERLRKRLQGR